jgi:excinuclease UvrABC nuclease subunit
LIFAGIPVTLDPASPGLEERLDALPPGPAVFAVWGGEGDPYIGRTGMLRRRLKRLLRERSGSRLLNLREVARRVEYWPVSSRLESTLVLYDVARTISPGRYTAILKLRMPPYVKLAMSLRFPRTQVTTRMGGGAGRYYGPFRTRASAELFEHELLDLFQIRRCQEDFIPSPEHPGCIYGEMNMCLRPCQEVVGSAEYASEVARVDNFLVTRGKQMLQTAQAARDRLSADLDFEEAARQHKRVEKIENVLKLGDELATDIDRLFGVAITPAAPESAVALWMVGAGFWQPPRTFSVALADQTTPIDRRLKEVLANVEFASGTARERQEHLAILARWAYSSWRDGEWIGFESPDRAPYRRIVGAISRTANRTR